MALLEVNDLQVRFTTPEGDVPAVRGVDFRLEAGQVLGIVGESGCGKTQSVLAMMGLLPGNARVSGQVHFEGRSLLGLSEAELNRLRGHRLSMVFQDPMTSLNPYLRIGRQLTEVLRRHQGLSRRAARDQAQAMLEAVRIPDARQRLDQYPHELSGGMRQRVMIAMALLCHPALLIADEPTTALDVTVQAQILALLADLRQQLGTAIILITHDLGVVARLCDRVAVMYAGQVVESADVQALFSRPQHPYTQALMSSIPRLDRPLMQRLPSIEGAPPNPAFLPGGCPFHPRCPQRLPKCETVAPPPTRVSVTHEARCHLLGGGDGPA